MGQLSGKVAIVTGASQGLGQAIAIAFGEEGASVACAARNLDKLKETCAAVEAAGGRACAVACDVRELSDIQTCVAKAVETFGRIDIVINNAQTIQYVFMKDASDQTMLDTLHSGPLASYRFMRAAFPHLKARGGGVIVTPGLRHSIFLFPPDMHATMLRSVESRGSPAPLLTSGRHRSRPRRRCGPTHRCDDRYIHGRC